MTPGFKKTKYLEPDILERERPVQNQRPHMVESWRGPSLWFMYDAVFLCLLMMKAARELCGFSFMRVLILLMGFHSHFHDHLITFQRLPLQIPSHWGFHYMNFRGEGQTVTYG